MARFALALLVALRVADAQDVFIPATQLRGSASASIAVPVQTQNASEPTNMNAELQCVPSNGECGGPGRRTEACCGIAKCTRLMGGGVMKCVEVQPTCVPTNRECGGPGRRTETCCGKAKCTIFRGGGVMKCVEEQPTCVPSNGECGGPGRRTETCCGRAKCTSLMGGGVMKCVEARRLAEGPNSVQMENSSLPTSSSTGNLSEAAAGLWCTPVDDKCGGTLGPFKWHKKCCGNAKCQKLFGSPDGTMKCVEEQPEPHGPAHGCWSSNGAICQYVFGESTGCYGTAAACSRSTGKPQGCYEYNGAICEWVVGDAPSNCYETKGRCEHHRRLSGASEEENRTLVAEAAVGTCNPDPHCSWQGNQCHCCYNGGCDYEKPCRCGQASSPQHAPAVQATQHNAAPMVAPINSYSEDSEAGVSEDPAGLNSTGMSAAASGLWCTPVDDKCGGTLGPFKWHKKCCGNAKCQKLFGSPDGTMKCVERQPEQQCVPLHGECGGPGRRTETCCHGTCESQRGSGIMKCAHKHDEQCAAHHAECGGPGRLTIPCCAPEFSCKKQFFTAVMKCM